MRVGLLSVLVFCLPVVAGCHGLRVAFYRPPAPHYRQLASVPIRGDDLDIGSLRRAAEASLRYFERVPEHRSYVLGYDRYNSGQLKRSVLSFLDIIETTDPALLHARLSRECRAYSPATQARFTAYYEPVLEARRNRDERFRYPIYRRPGELKVVRLRRFFTGDNRLINGWLSGNELVPYLSRRDIDGGRRLDGRRLELAWVDDPVALYFLHIQGSGRLKLPGGKTVRINFAASNGMAYTSIGRHMLSSGLIGAGSAPAIRDYLSAHPESRENIMFKNQRYIFFREVELDDRQGPLGSLGVPLVAGRSLAVDTRFVPPGVVAHISSDKPLIDGDGGVVWERFSRFAFSHDSGAAIKGPGRVDVYWGEGEKAGLAAGYLNRKGSLTLLVCGVEPSPGRIATVDGNHRTAYVGRRWRGQEQTGRL
jgi:membrane-bound lytic murein transglycosylase A